MQDWKETFGELKEQYIKRSAERLSKIVEIFTSLFQRPGDRDLLIELRTAFHWLAGSGTMYGFAEVSAKGAEGEALCEALLKDQRAPDANDLEKLKQLLNQLSSEFNKPNSNVDTNNFAAMRSPGPSKNEILVVEEDQNELNAL